MKKLAIILDSHAMRSEVEVKSLGFYFLPQMTILDGQEYADGIELILSRPSDFEKVVNAKSAKTSMPPIGRITEMFEKLSQEYEHIVYLPMTKSISGTYSAASAAAVSFPKVKVIDNNLLASGLVEVAKAAQAMANANKSITEIIKMMQTVSDSSLSFLVPNGVEGLIRSGRLTGLKKIILERAKLTPVIFLAKTEVKLESLKRSTERAIEAALKQILEAISTRMHEFRIEIVHTGGEFYKMAEKMLKDKGIEVFAITLTGTPFAAYLGKGAVALNAFLKPVI